MKKNEAIAFICQYQSLYGGNFIPSLLKLTEGVSQKGYNVVFIFPIQAKDRTWVKYLLSKNYQIQFVDFNQKRTSLLIELNRLVKNYNIQILHAHFGQFLNLEIYSLINRKIKTYIHIHSDFTAGANTFKDRVVNYLIFRLFSKRVTFLSVSKDFLKNNPKKIIWIPNGLAEQRIPCNSQSADEVRADNSIMPDECFCELFGWSPFVKGVDVAAKAVVLANQNSNKKIKLGIICGREYTTDRMAAYLKETIGIDPQDLENYFFFLNPTENVFAYHNAADLLLSASRSEGFPYSVLEMLSIGKKCVVSDIPGTAWSKDYPVVTMFRSEDVEECAEALRLAAETTHSDAEISFVKKDILLKYSIDEWVNKIVSCYGI